ncbi:MAG: tetratricopeptide repeat protein [Chitinophagales bacterium]|nr:tetratricopeptide repeat protein [Chitinophagales bacterium]
MKLFLKISLFILIPAFASAQQDVYFETWSNSQADSMLILLKTTDNDTTKMFLSRCLGFHYQETNRDSSLYFHQQQLVLARKLQFKLWEADALDQAGWVLSYLKNYPLSLEYFIEGINILENPDCEKNIWMLTIFSIEKDPQQARLRSLGFINNDLSQLYKATGNRTKEKETLYHALRIGESIPNSAVIALVSANLSQCYYALNQLDSSLFFGRKSIQQMNISDYKTYKGYVYNTIGNVYLKQGQNEFAKKYFDSAIIANIEVNSLVQLPNTYLSLSDLYRSMGQIDSALYYAKKALEDDNRFGGLDRVSQAYNTLYLLYKEQENKDSMFTYLRLSKTLDDSLNRVEKEKIYAYQNIGFNEQIKIKDQENERIEKENTIRIYVLLIGIGVFMLIAFLLYRNNRNRKKATELLQKQKTEIEVQKKNVEITLSELKSAQSQLIQSEKMASLGELTAGIAHEIQNPLNFVNNFSEVNSELIDELKTELAIGNKQQAIELADDIKANEQKINHHGKRADAIVKGMLQHSRSSTGKKELTDINSLCDEYLRLSYHGLRAKDKTFNATMKTDFDQTLEKINIIPQDIGRAILNVLTNAFYAVSEKKKQLGDGYEPTVLINTRKVNKHIEIHVNDNGNGIPQKVLDKIFQPFFTTKPTGQGTGLGLSLSYDIVKAHGGELKVETKEGEGSTFIISITQ